MNLPYLFLVLFCGLAVTAGIVLLLHLLRRKGNREKEAPEPSGPEESSSNPYEMTAIDQLLYDRCCRYMTERKPYLVDSFSLQDLANAVFTNKGYLSKTINRFSGRNFRQYVNYYRVMYAMELFRKNMNLRVSDLADLSGFHSVTSFFQNFKTVMGEPPSHWCSRMRRKQRNKIKNS